MTIRVHKKFLILSVLLMAICFNSKGFAETVFSEDYESGWRGWYADNGVWEVGTPTAGPSASHGGTSCVATVLDGNYPAYTDSRLISPSIILPTIGTNEEIHLRFWQWFSFAGMNYYYESIGYGIVQITTYDSSTGTWSSWTNVSDSVEGSSLVWSLMDVDLTAYANKKVRIGFFLDAGTYAGLGWYIDDITIEKEYPVFSGDFEHGWGSWSADNGVWEVGTPTTGPSASHGGTSCVATVSDGNYPAYTDSRLISPSIILPTIGTNEEIHLRFWQWFSFAGMNYYYESIGYGIVQITTYDSSTGTWSSWTNVSDGVEGSSSVWSLMDVDLTAYANKKVRIGFFLDAGTYAGLGWYIDDITIDGVSFSALSVTPSIQNVTAVAGTTTFSVSNTGTGTMPWTSAVTTGGSWLSIKSGVSGSNTGAITCAFTANAGTAARTGTVRITATGATGSPKDVTVTQAGMTTQTSNQFWGVWSDGVWTWNQSTKKWTKMSDTSSVQMVAAGDVDGDKQDDLIGVWTSGLWIRQTSNGQWVYLSQKVPAWIATGDITNDGLDDVIATWANDGAYYRDSATAKWVKFSEPARQLAAGKIGGARDDLIGVWNTGLWVRYSATAAWQKIDSTIPVWIAAGDMTGDSRADIVGSYGNGTWYRDSATTKWTSVGTSAKQLSMGDINNDGRDDLVGIWSNGVWVRYGKTGQWQQITTSTPKWITTGKVAEALQHAESLDDPLTSPEGRDILDLSLDGPSGDTVELLP